MFQSMPLRLVLCLLGLLATLLVFFLVNRMAVVRRRRFLQPLFLIATGLFLALLVMTIEWLVLDFGDALELGGLIFSFLFGLYGSQLIQQRYRALLVLVIPSKAPFNNEVRMGLVQGLEKVNVQITDIFGGVSASFEALPAFIPAMLEVALQRPDYVVLNAPSATQLDSPECLRAIREITGRGGRVICLEMAPTNIGEYKGFVTRISSDTDAGAAILAQQAIQVIPPGGTALLISGPEYSTQSVGRNDIMKEHLEKAGVSCKPYSLQGWTYNGSKNQTRECLLRDPPDVIICGNDTMALGAVRAIYELSDKLTKRPKVFGYDGIQQAIISIAQPQSPFYATIQTPPSAFGAMAAYIIKAEVNGVRRPAVENMEIRLPVDGAHLVTEDIAASNLESL